MDIVILKHIDQLGKRRCDIGSAFILDPLDPLVQHFLDHKRKILLFLRTLCLIQIHKYGKERSLTIGGHQCDHLILDRLYTLFDLFAEPSLNNPADHFV